MRMDGEGQWRGLMVRVDDKSDWLRWMARLTAANHHSLKEMSCNSMYGKIGNRERNREVGTD